MNSNTYNQSISKQAFEDIIANTPKQSKSDIREARQKRIYADLATPVKEQKLLLHQKLKASLLQQPIKMWPILDTKKVLRLDEELYPLPSCFEVISSSFLGGVQLAFGISLMMALSGMAINYRVSKFGRGIGNRLSLPRFTVFTFLSSFFASTFFFGTLFTAGGLLEGCA